MCVQVYNGYTALHAIIVYLLVCHNHYTNRRQHKHKTCTLARTSDGRKHHNNRYTVRVTFAKENNLMCHTMPEAAQVKQDFRNDTISSWIEVYMSDRS